MIKYLVGDVFDVMTDMDDDSVDLVLTSPPFLALRSYLPADHPDKSKEIGSEATPAEFVDVLLRLTAEWRRLLTPHGSICIELGDTYAGSGGAGGDYNDGSLREGQPSFDGSGKYARHEGRNEWEAAHPINRVSGTGGMSGGPGWPLAKSLTLIPEAYRFALAYGLNPHTGQPSPAGQWRIRNVIRWVRPNPPVGALGDKFRPATSELVVAATGKDRWFDLDTVRDNNPRVDEVGNIGQTRGNEVDGSMLSSGMGNGAQNPAGAPPLDWWKITPKGYAGAHYAVWPSELCVKPIQAMCPREVCRECGKPRRRITEQTGEYAIHRAEARGKVDESLLLMEQGLSRKTGRDIAATKTRVDAEYKTLGWSDCGHDNFRSGLVLDPFAGTGTTLAVAHGHGRDAIGIDIDGRNLDLARDRVGPMFLEEVA